jgi:mono/diheme cytochrome c family protein
MKLPLPVLGLLVFVGTGISEMTSAADLAAAAAAPSGPTPVQVESAAPKGTLKNPYKADNKDIVEQGHKLFFSFSCNGCHGGNGGGGICPPLINSVWVYDGDDDTLFRLVTLGSLGLQAKGYLRRGRENVVAPMPPFGTSISTADDLWKILTFVRSVYDGDPKYQYGNPPEPQPPPGD